MVGTANGRREPCDQTENEETVDVVGQLQRVEVVAGKDGEDAVETGDLVDYKSKGDELGGGAEGDDVEEGLSCTLVYHCLLLAEWTFLTLGFGNRRTGAMVVFADGGSQGASASKSLQNGLERFLQYVSAGEAPGKR